MLSGRRNRIIYREPLISEHFKNLFLKMRTFRGSIKVKPRITELFEIPYIDEFTPCLKDGKTGQLIDTEVVRVVRKSLLQHYNRKNGWYVDWITLLDENEIYVLVIKGTIDIQGLVAVKDDINAKACYICWMCTAPENNKLLVDIPKYMGVGGHLFAIAAKNHMIMGIVDLCMDLLQMKSC